MTSTRRQFTRTTRVQSIQYTVPGPASTTREIIQWAHAGRPPEFGAIVVDHGTYLSVILHVIPMAARPGDCIIRDATCAFFTCQPDVFPHMPQALNAAGPSHRRIFSSHTLFGREPGRTSPPGP